nr:hypothetical protein [Tanacetum cinerariifolium]
VEDDEGIGQVFLVVEGRRCVFLQDISRVSFHDLGCEDGATYFLDMAVVHTNGHVEEIRGTILASEIMKANPRYVLKKHTSLSYNNEGVAEYPKVMILSPNVELQRAMIGIETGEKYIENENKALFISLAKVEQKMLNVSDALVASFVWNLCSRIVICVCLVNEEFDLDFYISNPKNDEFCSLALVRVRIKGYKIEFSSSVRVAFRAWSRFESVRVRVAVFGSIRWMVLVRD